MDSRVEMLDAELRNKGVKLSPELEAMRQEGLKLIYLHEVSMVADNPEYDDMAKFVSEFEERMLDED